ncbi:MAG: tRNA pseudouridine(38-40) synthase TruA [Bacteriovoracaceae bacterium]|nr:tRNA pseudouridine(38-40) synthase TruA [Bacteriovoracaceae bacterium]
MHYYRVTVAYKGTRYHGWQVQPQEVTVQGEINKALAKVSKSDDVRSIGSGRTDAGVHARGQVARLDTPLEINPESLLKALNTFLPPDIRIVESEKCTGDFQPTFDAVSKWYSYFFTISPYPDPLVGDLIAQYGFDLDFEKVQAACKLFEGRHDFVNFYTEGTDINSSVRTIHSCELIKPPLSELPFPFYGPVYEIRIHGEGFLKQMVRMMVGAIWNVGRGKIPLEAITKALNSQRGERLGAVAPGDGLYLMRVVYPQN